MEKTSKYAQALIVVPKMMRYFLHSFRPKTNIVIKKSELSTLMILNLYPEIPMKDCLEILDIESGSFTYVSNRLIEKELIDKVQDTVDKRVFLLKLTAKGKELADDIQKQLDIHLTKQLEVLSDEDRNTLYKAAKLLTSVMKNLEKNMK